MRRRLSKKQDGDADAREQYNQHNGQVMQAFSQAASGTVNITIAAEYSGETAFFLLHQNADDNQDVDANQHKK